MPIHDTRATLGDLVLTARSLAVRLADAEDAQWTGAPHPRPHAETAQRVTAGRPGDPTAAVALDDLRLALRAAVIEGEAALRAATTQALTAERHLERALSTWHGEQVDADAAPGDGDGTPTDVRPEDQDDEGGSVGTTAAGAASSVGAGPSTASHA